MGRSGFSGLLEGFCKVYRPIGIGVLGLRGFRGLGCRVYGSGLRWFRGLGLRGLRVWGLEGLGV